MERIANISGAVTGFSVSESYIDCICGKELIKILFTVLCETERLLRLIDSHIEKKS